MIKAKFQKPDGDITLFFGLDKENLRRLRDRKPIFINKDQMGIQHNIIIAGGETLDDIQEEFNLPRITGPGEITGSGEIQ